MLGSELLTRVAIILQDTSHVRWPLTELVYWINDGQRAIVLAKPSAKSASVEIELEEGTLQTLPTAYLALLRIPCNLTAITPRVRGRAIRPTTRDLLDSSEPNWHSNATVNFNKTVRQYVYDEQNPREFYVYPGNDGTGLIEAVVSTLPTDLVATGATDLIGSYATALSLPETYSVPLLDYVVFRAFAKDDIAAEVSRARLHYQAFASVLGLKMQVERATNPAIAAKVTSV